MVTSEFFMEQIFDKEAALGCGLYEALHYDAYRFGEEHVAEHSSLCIIYWEEVT